ncbi:MAG: hypothetical protein IJS96_09405 [Schwartzia sp.]|nr:hypothetical protein [Schwartzia sp. (in: firmicutes)]
MGWDTIVVDYHNVIARENDTVDLDTANGDSYCTIDHSGSRNTYRSSYLHNRCTFNAPDHSSNNIYGVSLGGDQGQPYRGPFWGCTIDLADGDDEVILRHTSDYNSTLSHISLRGGNDTLRVSGPYEVAMKYTEANLGDGDDVMEVKGVGNYAGGSAQNVTVYAGAGADTLSFEKGIDVVGAPVAAYENWRNFIDLGAGADRFTVGGKVNKADIDAGADNDGVTITGAVENTAISLGSGADTLSIGHSINGATIDAGTDADGVTIGGAVRNSRISLGDDNDTLTIGGSLGGATVDAGAGNDGVTVGGAMTDAAISLGDGNDMLSMGGAISSSTVDAGAGDDLMTVGGALTNSAVSLGAGNDKLTINGSVNGAYTGATIDAGAGNDGVTVNGAIADAAIFLGDGNDTLAVTESINGDKEPANIDLGDGDDSFFVGGVLGYASLSAGDGNDTVTVTKGIQGSVSGRKPVIVDLGAGENHLTVDPGAASGMAYAATPGGNGRDTFALRGGGVCLDFATVLGGNGRDSVSLWGMVQNHAVVSLAGGDDVLLLEVPNGQEAKPADKTQFITGEGNDLVSVKGSIHLPLVIDSGNGDNTIFIEGLSGNTVQAGAGADAIVVNGASNTVYLTADADGDQVTVGGENNTIFADKTAGAGVKDKLTIDGTAYIVLAEGMTARDLDITGSGTWVLIGGGSDDDTVEPVVVDGVTINAGDGRWILTGRSPDTVRANRYGDSVFTDGGNDSAEVTGGHDYVNLGAGDDTLVLSGDNSTIVTGAGNDQATVNSSSAKIDLGEGSDTLTFFGLGGTITAGLGDDVLDVTGGTGHSLDLGHGADSICIRATYETIYAGTGNDTLIFDGTAAGTNTDGFNYVALVEDNNLVSLIGGDGWTTINGGVSADSLFFTNGDVEKDVLNLGAGNDYIFFDSQAGQSWGGNIARANNTSVKAGKGDDSIFAWSAEQAMFNGGTGDDSINLVNARYTTIVGGSGDDSIVLGKDNNGNIATDKSTGYNFVNLVGDASDTETGGSTGHNIVTIGGNLTNNTIIGGSEKDVFDLSESGGRNEVTLNAKNSTVVAALRDDTITAAAKGVDIIDGSAVQALQEVVINNYSIADKDILAGANDVAFVRADGSRGLLEAAFKGTTSVFKADGTVVTAQNGAFNANVTPTEGDSGVQVYVQDTVYGANATQAVWFATDYGSNINAAKDHVKVAMVLTGANNDAADTIIGGDLADTMHAGTGDTLAGGLGNDSLVNVTAVNASREEFGIARYTGKDTVQNFDGGFGASDDAVLFYEGTLANGTSAVYNWAAGAGTLTINNGSGSLVLQMADGNDSIAAHTVLRNGTTGANERLTAIAANSTEVVTDAMVAKYYYGSRNGGSAIDISGLSFGVKIDLGNNGRYFEAGENYSYITAVTGSNGGDNFLAGAGETAETLTGGDGVNNTLYGGGSANDLLTGGGKGAFGVEAADTFYFGSSDGKDVIRNIGNGDKVMLYDLKDDGSVTAETVTMNGGSYLRLTANTGASLFIESVGSETYEVLFTDGVNGDVTARYEVTGTEFRKV